MSEKSRSNVQVGRNPFRGFVDMMSEMNRVQAQWMLHGKGGHGGERSLASAYAPPVDIFAQGQDLVVRCELPGIKRDAVSVTVSNGLMTISGFRDSALDERNVVFYTRERVYGAFRRNMVLPEGIGQDDIHASLKNGLLELVVRGGAAAKPKKIDIIEEDDG